MAPRRRPAKKGQTRMDAALDAMSPYGFPRKLVRRTVDQLLKVYGGNEGWVFIEDSAYTLLINTLLENQTTTPSSPLAQAQDGLIEDNPGDGLNEAPPASCSNRALVPCSNSETSDDTPLANKAVDDTVSAASETGNQLLVKAVDTTSATSKTGNELPIKPVDILSTTSEPGNKLSIKTVDTVSATTETGNQVPIKALDTVSSDNESDCQPSGNLSLDEVHGITPAQSSLTKSSQPVGRLCHKKRRPCHGWISNDEEEEELIELPPAPLSKLSYMLANDWNN